MSVASDERKDESIDTQLEIGKAFVREQEDMVLYSCYTDLGKTGTDFEREGFERMMQDVRLKKIDCIIVKDLSRFGRNYVETGNYIEKIFPFLGVRFIALTEQFDNRKYFDSNGMISLQLKNLVNEMYARDIAVKVKSAKKAKWEQGSYTGGIAPYGYLAKWEDGIKHLKIEETTSQIVKKIFDLFLADKSMKEIKTWLYEHQVHRPKTYRNCGHVFLQEGEILQEWSQGTIKELLTNPVYTGCLVQGMTCGKDYLNHKRHAAASKDWAIKEHTHEAIICEETFVQAAKKFEKRSVYSNQKGFSKTIPLEEDIFSNLLFCGECKSKMKRTYSIKKLSSKDRVRYYYYYCPAADGLEGRLECNKKHISLEMLQRLLRIAIYQEVFLTTLRQKDLIEISCQEADRQKESYRKRLYEIERKISCITKNTSEKYTKYRIGLLNEEVFLKEKATYDAQMDALKKQMGDITQIIQKMDLKMEQKNSFFRSLFDKSRRMEFTKEELEILIHRIEVYPDNRMKVIFAFQREWEDEKL